MAKTLGNHIKAWIRATSIDEIEVFTWLGGEQSNSVNRTAEAVEVSDKSNDWAQFIAGKKGATIEITVFADAEDDAQLGAIKALVAGTRVEYAIGDVDTDEDEPVFGEYGFAIITAVSDTNDFGSVASRTISLTATGESEFTPEEDEE